jgi:hypothetical protein
MYPKRKPIYAITAMVVALFLATAGAVKFGTTVKADCGSQAISCCASGKHWNNDLGQCTNDAYTQQSHLKTS